MSILLVHNWLSYDMVEISISMLVSPPWFEPSRPCVVVHKEEVIHIWILLEVTGSHSFTVEDCLKMQEIIIIFFRWKKTIPKW